MAVENCIQPQRSGYFIMMGGNRKLVDDVTVVFLSARARNVQIRILSEETQLEGTWHAKKTESRV